MALDFIKAGTKPCISDPILPTQEVVSWIFVRRAQKALLYAPAPLHTCGSCWLGTTRQLSHVTRNKSTRSHNN